MINPMLPTRFRATCELCNRDLDTRAEGVHQWTAGWVMQRAGGGGHAVALPKRENRWAHRYCVEKAAKGHVGQTSMFDAPKPPPAPPEPTNAHYDEGGRLIHNHCKVCGADAPFGVGVSLLKGNLGMWYCQDHHPDERLRSNVSVKHPA